MTMNSSIDVIVKDWESLDLEKLGDKLFSTMVEDNPEIGTLFAGDAHPGMAQQGLKSQAATFIGFMSYAMNWLKKKDLTLVEQNMVELGQRHVKYGVNVSHFITFQEAMFVALREQLGANFESNKYAWTFTWLRFVVGPMMRGLFEAGSMSREAALDVVATSFREIQNNQQFADKLFEHLFKLDPSTKPLFQRTNLVQHKSKFVGFIGQGLQMLKRPDGGKAELRRLATMHKNMGVSGMNFIFFEEAVIEALRLVLGVRFTSDLASAWTYVIHTELIMPQLMAPFEELDTMFAQFKVSHNGVLSFPEWTAALQSFDIPNTHIEAGFAALDPTGTGGIKLAVFKQALVNQQMEHPDLDHKQHLTLFCQDCFHDVYGVMPVKDMIKTVLDQWATVDYNRLGESVFSLLLQNPNISQLFQGKHLKKQAAMFVGFMQYAMNWLKEDDLVKLEAKMHALGSRHVVYGVDISHLATFQEAFFTSLREILGASFESNKYAWTFTLLHFIMGPMMRGLFEKGNVSRDAAIALATKSFEEVKKESRFAEALFEHLFQLEPSAQQLFRDKDLIAHKDKFVGFIGTGLQMLASPGGGKAELRRLAQMHNAMGVTAMHFVFFEEAFLMSLRELYQDSFAADLATAWMYVLHFELIEPQLLAPFADLEDHLATVRTRDGVTLNMQEWSNVVAPLRLSAKQVQQGFKKLDVDGTGQVPLARFKKAVISMGMLDPHRTYDQNLRMLCEDASANVLSQSVQAVACPQIVAPKATTAELLTRCPYVSSNGATTTQVTAQMPTSCPYTGTQLPVAQAPMVRTMQAAPAPITSQSATSYVVQGVPQIMKPAQPAAPALITSQSSTSYVMQGVPQSVPAQPARFVQSSVSSSSTRAPIVQQATVLR